MACEQNSYDEACPTEVWLLFDSLLTSGPFLMPCILDVIYAQDSMLLALHRLAQSDQVNSSQPLIEGCSATST